MDCIRLVTSVELGIASIHSLIRELSEPYEGYPISGVLVLGVGWLILTHIFAFGVSGLPWRQQGGQGPSPTLV
jgi:NSS family neurotransmitter:Na+ symporter